MQHVLCDGHSAAARQLREGADEHAPVCLIMAPFQHALC